jgi:hypothetical protein
MSSSQQSRYGASSPPLHLQKLPLARLETDFLNAPGWSNRQEAVKWFLQLRRAPKSIVYRFLLQIQEARAIFEESDATGYLDYTRLGWALSGLWHGWKVFISQNTMTSEFLADTLNFCDLPSAIKCMKTPKKASRKCTWQMRGIRSYASSI